MENKKDLPPKKAQRFLLSFLRHNLAEEVLGDLDEYFYRNLKNHSPRKRAFLYWVQVAKYLRPFAIRKFNQYTIINTDMFRNYFFVSLRNLMKHKLFSAINIGGMALSLTTVLLIALYVTDAFQYDRHVSEAERKFRLYTNYYRDGGSEIQQSMVPPMLGVTLRTDFPEVEYVTRLGTWLSTSLIKAGDKSLTVKQGAYADPTVFDMFSLTLLEGDRASALHKPRQIAFSESTSKKFFGNESAVGKSIELSGETYQVVAVFRDFDLHSHVQLNYFVSMETLNNQIAERMQSWRWSQFHSYVKLKEGASADFLAGKFNTFIEKDVWPRTKPDGFYYVAAFMPITDIHLKAYNQLWDLAERGNIQTIYILAGLAAFILLISILNFINLSTARAISRTKEVGVRKVAGAYRSQLMMQFTSEAVLTAVLALAIALVATVSILPFVNDFLGKSINGYQLLQPTALALVVGGAIVMGLLAGAYPAFIVSGYKPAGMLGKSSSTGKTILRESLVVVQFAISFLLIIGAWVVNDQHAFMRNTNMGFQKDNILVMRMRDSMYQHMDRVKQQFQSVDGVEVATLGYGLPGEGFAGDGIIDQKTKKQIPTSMLLADEDFVPTLKLELVAGRNFSKDFPADVQNAFIISEAMATQLGYQNPADAIQHPIAWNMWAHPDSLKTGVVVGVIKDMQLSSMRDKVSPIVLHMDPSNYYSISLRISSQQIPATIAGLEKVWKEQGTDWPFEYHFLDQNYDTMYKSEERLSGLFSAFSSFTIIVACMGLFGLVMYSTTQRYKEIGIRKTMGARESSLVLLLSRSYFLLLVISFAVAAPLGYWAAGEWLSSFAYHIPLTVSIFIKSATVIAVLALVTVGLQALKAARSNPVNVLRTE